MYEDAWRYPNLWRWMNWWQRVDIVLLAGLLAYVFFVLLQVFKHYRLGRCAKAHDGDTGSFDRERRKLIAELNAKVSNLNSIAFVAPYLGLAGTCTGIVTGLDFAGGEWESPLTGLISAMPIIFITTAAGLLVAIAAAWFYNYLCARIDSLKGEADSDMPAPGRPHSRFIQNHSIAVRPDNCSFPLIAVPILAVLAGLVFMEYSSYQIPVGLWVRVTAANCESYTADRLIVLRLTDEGKLFLNYRQVDEDSLAPRLSEIYRLHQPRTLDLIADEGVPFQHLADVIDRAKSGLSPDSIVPLHISMQRSTDNATDESCLPSLAIRPADVR